MDIYNYSVETKEFISRGPADANPLEPGKFLIPGNATDIQPPACAANEVAVFDGGSWVIKPDFRGQDFYSKSTGQKIRVQDIGALSDDLTPLTPFENASWDATLGSWKLDQVKAMTSIRAQRDSLLSMSDWTQISDAPLSATQKAAWATYRQALRDFPEACDIASPQWPVQPK